MTLVIADCVPRRTPWPRGLLLGIGIALKLTPGGVSALFPPASRQSRGADLGGVFRRRDTGRFRAGMGRLVGVLDSHFAAHRPDWDGVVEHRPEHRGCTGPNRRA